MSGCSTADAEDLLGQLPGVSRGERGRFVRFEVAGHPFAYSWPATSTLGVKQLVADQLDLVAERPSVFEVQFTAGAYGWVVIDLRGVGRDELAELIFEAWRLSAPSDVVAARADRLPT